MTLIPITKTIIILIISEWQQHLNNDETYKNYIILKVT
jgi:hypothetical protein